MHLQSTLNCINSSIQFLKNKKSIFDKKWNFEVLIWCDSHLLPEIRTPSSSKYHKIESHISQIPITISDFTKRKIVHYGIPSKKELCTLAHLPKMYPRRKNFLVLQIHGPQEYLDALLLDIFGKEFQKVVQLSE